MRFSKRLRSIRQLSTHVLAVILAVLLTVGTLQVSPSQAEPAPSSVTANSPLRGSAVAPGGNHATCYKSAEPTADASSRETRPTHCLPNAVAPQDRTASPTQWLPSKQQVVVTSFSTGSSGACDWLSRWTFPLGH